jgi:hypothetical protein
LSKLYNKPALLHKMLHSVPIRMINYAIKARECSPSIISLDVWVAELSQIEHSEEVTRLLHKEQNTELQTRARALSSSTSSRTRNDRNDCTAPTKVSLFPTGDSKPTQVVSTVTPYHPTSGAMGAGPMQTFVSNACHACGQVGHYRGDPKCPMVGTYSRNNSWEIPQWELLKGEGMPYCFPKFWLRCPLVSCFSQSGPTALSSYPIEMISAPLEL